MNLRSFLSSFSTSPHITLVTPSYLTYLLTASPMCLLSCSLTATVLVRIWAPLLQVILMKSQLAIHHFLNITKMAPLFTLTSFFLSSDLHNVTLVLPCFFLKTCPNSLLPKEPFRFLCLPYRTLQFAFLPTFPLLLPHCSLILKKPLNNHIFLIVQDYSSLSVFVYAVLTA